MRRVLFGLTLISALLPAKGVQLKAPFGDGMVLQRDRNVPVCGSGVEPGGTVRVNFSGQTKTCVADTNGQWRVDLDPMAASCDGRDLVVESLTCPATRVVLKDVLVGEVWFACGQSNMQVGLWGGSPRYRDARGGYVAQVTERPLIRFTGMCRGRWRSVTRGDSGFSALAYYYALELHDVIRVPVGMIVNAIGGCGIDPFIPPSQYRVRKDLADLDKFPLCGIRDKWNHAWTAGPIDSSGQQPKIQWINTISNLVPFAFRGVIWYQGETNGREPERYCSKLHALYDGWSQEFENPNMKLYIAELAPFDSDWFAIRQAQRRFVREEPNAAIAITCDVGNPRDIHPNDKRTVAQRLVLHALKRDYGYSDITDDSPELVSSSVVSNRFVLRFANADGGFYVYNDNRSSEVPFEIAGADGQWQPAYIGNFENIHRGTITNDYLNVFSPKVAAPKALRYLYNPPGAGRLYGPTGLPVGCFEIKAN